MAIRPSERMLILACSAIKPGYGKYVPAIERYDGPLWRTSRTVDPRCKKAKVVFLPAHHGADTPIEMYHARMTKQTATAKVADLGMPWPQQQTLRQVMLSGEHLGMHLSSPTAYTRKPFTEIALVGGRFYRDATRYLVDLLCNGGYLVSHAGISEIICAIGLMRRDLRRWLDTANGEGR